MFLIYEQVQDYLARAEELKTLMKPKKMPQVKYHPSISGKNRGSNTTPRRSNSADESRGNSRGTTTSPNTSITSDDGSHGSNSANTSLDESPTRGLRRSCSSPAESPTQSPNQSAQGVSDDVIEDVDLTKSIKLGMQSSLFLNLHSHSLRKTIDHILH